MSNKKQIEKRIEKNQKMIKIIDTHDFLTIAYLKNENRLLERLMKKEPINMITEEKIKTISQYPTDKLMRLNLAKFAAYISLDDKYMDLAINTNRDKKKIELCGLLKTIRNSEGLIK